eukprot:SAG11_NODE_4747_length_1781_cov_106.263830_2_plen_110_part_00
MAFYRLGIITTSPCSYHDPHSVLLCSHHAPCTSESHSPSHPPCVTHTLPPLPLALPGTPAVRAPPCAPAPPCRTRCVYACVCAAQAIDALFRRRQRAANSRILHRRAWP